MSNRCLSAVFQHSVSKGSARLVLLAMADEAHDSGLLAAYKRSHSHLASKANVDAGTVGRAIKSLCDLGELALLERGDGRKSSDYRLLLPGLDVEGVQVEGPQDATPGAAARGARGGETQGQGPQHAPPIIPVSPGDAPSDPEPLALLDVESAFDAFYRDYPHKVGKPAALKAYRAAVNGGAAPVSISLGLDRWLAFWKASRTEQKFMPHPATWLNQARWNDSPVASRSDVAGPRGAVDDDRGGVSGLVTDL